MSLELFSLIVVAILLVALLIGRRVEWLKEHPLVQAILMVVEVLIAFGAIAQYHHGHASAGWLF